MYSHSNNFLKLFRKTMQNIPLQRKQLFRVVIRTSFLNSFVTCLVYLKCYISNSNPHLYWSRSAQVLSTCRGYSPCRKIFSWCPCMTCDCFIHTYLQSFSTKEISFMCPCIMQVNNEKSKETVVIYSYPHNYLLAKKDAIIIRQICSAEKFLCN